ncbi:MAG: hypothetical protein ABMA64_15515 [Myxococcota bacterium]
MRPVVAVTLVSFSLAALPQVARGTPFTSTTSTSVAVVTGLVVVIILVVKKPKPQPVPALARSLLDAGLVSVRGGLGTELALAVESPDAFEQLEGELARGAGPALDALVTSTGLSAQALAAHWEATRGEIGAVADEAGALRFTAAFVGRLAAEATASPEVELQLLEQLHRESLDPASAADGPAHRWLAQWWGVPPAAAAEATHAAFADLAALGDADRRGQLSVQRSGYLDRIAGHVDAHHAAAVEGKFAALTAAAGPWLAG